MLFKNVDIVDESFNIKENMNVLVKNGRISYVGSDLSSQVKLQGDEEVYDGKNKLLLPGFVNSHAHTPMTLLRGYSENKVLQKWLFDSVFPFEGKMTAEDVYNGMMLGIAEMLSFGIVSTTDMYFFCDKMCQAALETGTKFNISNGMTCFDNKSFKENNSYIETQSILKNYHRANDGSILVDASVHGEYTSNPEIVSEVVEYATANGLNMHLHLSETKTEHEECVERRGVTPAEYFSKLGVFDLNTTAAHCVWVTKDDIEILKAYDVTVAANPVSNLKLASGICPAIDMMKSGINVAIGTDGVASNNNLNMQEEMKVFALLQKVAENDPTAIMPSEALKAVTYNGCVGQGRSDSGLIKEGFRADLIVVDMDKPYYYPRHNLINNLVYSGSGADVCMTMVNGKVLYKDGEYTTLDIECVKYNAQKSVNEILARL